MSVFKCKMCGGDLVVEEGKRVCECECCGSKQTLPKLDNEKKISLFMQANEFRDRGEFDNAAEIYETILNEDKTDAELYWLIVLCKYGIKYVEDPATHKRVPTVNRTNLASSVLDDVDYNFALEYATMEQKDIYESEAKAIYEIQKGKLEIANKEKHSDCQDPIETSRVKRKPHEEYEIVEEKKKGCSGCLGCLSICLSIPLAFLIIWVVIIGIEWLNDALGMGMKSVQPEHSPKEVKTKYIEDTQTCEFRQKEFEMLASVKKSTGVQWSKMSKNSMNWKEAREYCDNLKEDELTDWRLPDIYELKTLIDNGKSKIGDTGGFWSSSSYNGSDISDYAYAVFFDYGHVKSYPVENDFYVRCISALKIVEQRIEEEQQQEKIKAEQAKFAHLEWSDKSSHSMNWNSAEEYCKNLPEGGHSDWRLPTISELRSLIRICSKTQIGGQCNVTDDCLSSGDCKNDACRGCSDGSSGKYSRFCDNGRFWSSSAKSNNTNDAWIVDFVDGSVGYGHKAYNDYVRCVR